jgi:hypothetical protein
VYPAHFKSDPPLIVGVDGTLPKADLLSRERKARRFSFTLIAAAGRRGMSDGGQAEPLGAGTGWAVRWFFDLGIRRAKGTMRAMFRAASA